MHGGMGENRMTTRGSGWAGPVRAGRRPEVRRVHSAVGRWGVTLIEVVVASFLAALVLVPLLIVFGQSHGLTVRQVDLEIARKLAEAALSQMMSVKYQLLENAGGGISVPFNLEIPGVGMTNISLPLSGSPAQGQTSVTVVNSTFQVRVEIGVLYRGIHSPPLSPPPPRLKFVFSTLAYTVPNSTAMATVTQEIELPDSVLTVVVTVDYPSGSERKQLILSTCRADLNL